MVRFRGQVVIPAGAECEPAQSPNLRDALTMPARPASFSGPPVGYGSRWRL